MRWHIASDDIAREVYDLIGRNMTKEEWETYVAKDIEYEKTKTQL